MLEWTMLLYIQVCVDVNTCVYLNCIYLIILFSQYISLFYFLNFVINLSSIFFSSLSLTTNGVFIHNPSVKKEFLACTQQAMQNRPRHC